MEQVYVSKKHKVVVVPKSHKLGNIPIFNSFEKDGVYYAVIPHSIYETILLNHLGYNVPSPIEEHYDWGACTPFKVQVDTCSFLTLNKRAYVLNGLGTGKTKSAIWAYHYLRSNGLAGRALVVAPLSTLMDVWGKEIFNTAPSLKFSVLHGSKSKRLDNLTNDVDVFIINHDGVGVIYDELLSMAKTKDLSVLILDELSVYRNINSRSKTMANLAANFEWVWGMTGTPTPNAPTDVWAQCKIVTPWNVPQFFSKFREMTMQRVSQFKWEPKENGLHIAYNAMQPSVRFTLDDITELPELILQDREVLLSKKQKLAYEQIRKTAQAQIGNHEISAVNAAVALGKMLQISMGWTYDNKGKTAHLDNTDRIQALVDVIEASNDKVSVFVPFKHALSGISEALTKAKIDHAVVSGDTSLNERTDIFRLFQTTSKYKVLCAHPKCMSHGLTLTAASVVVWFAPVTSAEIYEQANGRVHRLGQTKKQLVMRMMSSPVEKRLYAMLDKKQNIQSQLLAMFADNS